MRLIYHPKVLREDIPKIPTDILNRIQKTIENKLMTDPAKYGLFLHGSLKGYRKIRVGDWRIVYHIVNDEVRIITLSQRKNMKVYNLANLRKDT